MENKETMKEVMFLYLLDDKEHEGVLYLDAKECDQVRKVLKKNPEAEFNDLPKSLYQAFVTAAWNQSMDYGVHDDSVLQLQKPMPENLLDLCEEVVLDDSHVRQVDKPKELKIQVSAEVLNQIASGEVTTITLEINSANERELIQIDEEGYAVEDENGNSTPVEYDVLHLYAGRSTTKSYVKTTIAAASTALLTDEDGNIMSHMEGDVEYYEEEISYEIGEIIENHIAAEKEGPSMKCLAVRQPWAQLIVCGIKDIECRDAMPAPRKPKVFIAASGTKLKWEDLGEAVQEIYTEYERKGVLPAYKDLPTKCIVGYVDIVKTTFDEVESPWGADHDGIKYILRNAEILDEPIYGMNKATPYFYNVEGYDENHLPKSHKVDLK